MNKIESVNEFVIRFANINGTGSASANGMLAKSFFKLGLPIGPKNIFPSNIQGLPTWYEVRVSESGYTGRRGNSDITIAMNPQTFKQDVAALREGGYLVYDSTRLLRESDKRQDVNYIGIPISEMARDNFSHAKSRDMLKNIIYVGSVAALLDIDLDIFHQLIKDQFATKPKLHESNFLALKLGYEHAKEHYLCPCGIKVAKRDLVGSNIILNGNEALGLGAVYAGATVAGWYPLTPSTSVIEAFNKYCHKFREEENGDQQYAIIQAEDEISAAGMVLGAAWNGSRSFSATSGPGISLMSEFIGYAYYTEIPMVLFNIQRCGPSTGMPTRTQQSDLLLCTYASHGDSKHILLFPSSVKECFEFSVLAFDLADRYQTPVIVMSDLELGMNDYVSEPLEWDDSYQHDRGKVLDQNALETTNEKFYRYLDVDNDGVTYRTYPGVHPSGAYFTRGSGHDKFGRYTEDGALYQENMERISKKFQTAVEKSLPKPKLNIRDANNKVGIVTIGTTYEPLREATEILSKRGMIVNEMLLLSFPFGPEVWEFCQKHDKVIVIDQNRDAQLKTLLVNDLQLDPNLLESICSYDGNPVMASFLVDSLAAKIEGAKI